MSQQERSDGSFHKGQQAVADKPTLSVATTCNRIQPSIQGTHVLAVYTAARGVVSQMLLLLLAAALTCTTQAAGIPQQLAHVMGLSART